MYFVLLLFPCALLCVTDSIEGIPECLFQKKNKLRYILKFPFTNYAFIGMNNFDVIVYA